MGDIEAPTVGRNCSNSFGCIGRLHRLDEACTQACGDEGDELVRELDEPERPARSPRPAPDPLSLAGGTSYSFRLEFATTNPRDSLDPGSVRLGWVQIGRAHV